MRQFTFLDLETGEYNISYVERYFPGQKMALIKGSKEAPGLYSGKGKSKGNKEFF